MRFFNLAILLCLIVFSFSSEPVQASRVSGVPVSAQAVSFGSASLSRLAQIAWNQPANLSRSGAASQPRLVFDANGAFQAFWMDKFDGLVTAVYNGSLWSLPVLVPYDPLAQVRNPNATTVPLPPEMYVDSQNRIHAFWHTPPDPLTGQPALNENLMLVGTTAWSPAVRIAESALTFDPGSLSNGEIYLGYIRNYKSDLFEPGVYVRETFGGATWQTALPVHTSIYYRNLLAPPAMIKTASAGNQVSMVWTEPRLGSIYSADSFDQGATWTVPQVIEFTGTMPANPIVLPLADGSLLRVWQDSAQTSCTLYQQQLVVTGAPTQPEPELTQTPAAPAAAVPAGEWSQPVRILAGLQTCPTGSNFFLDGNQLYWYWGEGTATIYLTAWDAANSTWYDPHPVGLNFEDVETRRFVQLDELTLAIKNGVMMLAGTDKTSNEVWAATADRSALEFASAPPSPWMQPVAVTQPGQLVREPAVAVDTQGWMHIVWSQELNNSGSSLYYSRYDDQQALQPAEIFKGGNGTISRQPAMLSDAGGSLHLVWVGGVDGQLNYSKSLADKAGSAFGWVPAKELDEKSAVSRPQLAQAATGRLYAVYAIPRNEQRGVYLVYSDDSGDSWSAPLVVFDAVAAGWEGVDRPAVALAPGGVHVAFARLVEAGALPTDGIYYTRALLESDNASFEAAAWSEPFRITEGGTDWPRLVFLSGQLHLLFSNGTSLGQRWLLTSQQQADGSGWGDVSRVPGWQDLILDGSPPYSAVVDAFNLYLVSAATGGTGIRYSVWSVDSQDTAAGRWSQQEIFNPSGQWTNSDSAAVSSTVPSGGKLLVAWLAQATAGGQATQVPTLPALLFSIRSLEAVQPPAAPTTPPSAAETNQATPTAQPTGTPTLVLVTNPASESSQSPISPQALGGGLAAIIVIIIFVGIMMRGRSHAP